MKVLRSGLPITAFVLGLCQWTASSTFGAVTVSIGVNFTGTTYAPDSFVGVPPDPNGAIGPNHFVELINGSFAVYNKTTGAQVKRISDLKFWSNAGVILSTTDAVTDPRVIYDPTVQRWFASMVDLDSSASDPTLESNDYLLAVSDGSNPTLGWHGWALQADPDHGYFADFPTLGVDSNAVYLSGDMYQGQLNPLGAGLFSFPKADLLAASPTITNRTWFGVMDYSLHGDVLQPAICMDGSETGKILAVTDIGLDSNPHSNLVSSVVLNGGRTNATLTAATFIPTAPWMVPDNPDFPDGPLLTVMQPDNTSALMANDARFAAKVYAVGGVLYAVHNTLLNNRVAIQWYRVRAADDHLLEAGTFSDPSLDLFFPSIAVNASGIVVIAYNACGLSTTVSCFARVGQTVNGVTSFGSSLLLQAGATSYHGDDEQFAPILGTPPFSRWGDYSATSVDPSNPNIFWTIQMYPSDGANNDVWSTQIIQLITSSQPSLTVSAAGRNVTISWPAGILYRLQSATSLNSPVSWSNYAQSPVTNGQQVSVTVSNSTGQQFFRLQSL